VITAKMMPALKRVHLLGESMQVARQPNVARHFEESTPHREIT